MQYLFTLTFIFFSFLTTVAQSITYQALSDMPEKVSNNAVCSATVAGTPYLFSFSGIDSTKSCDGDHLRSFRYNVETDEWETIAPLPDDLGGKIAAGASTVKNKIYIIGGYHLASNCGETSSGKVHIYDPETNTYLPDGATIPKAIDDQVQAVWRDSLIYVITGWSNTNNVVDVQIYDPTNDNWTIGTSIPNNSQWRVFGASGAIIGDTIYFAGGAGNWSGSNFPPTLTFRKGYINPENPSEITWEGELAPKSRGYRMAASTFDDKVIWLGGSDVTYNFDGIAYNGSGGVSPLDRISFYDPGNGAIEQLFGFIPAQMDFRGVGKISENQFILAGGMIENQEVTNKTWLITIDNLTTVSEESSKEVGLFPNPVRDQLYIDVEANVYLEILDFQGKTWQTSTNQKVINVEQLPSGVYILSMHFKDGKTAVERFLKH